MSQSTLLRLMTLLSPAFPVGGFAYSSGLEQAVADCLVSNPGTLQDWLEAALQAGALRNDTILLSLANRGTQNEANELAIALAGCHERYLETTAQGDSFIRAVEAAGLPCPRFAGPVAYAVAVGAVSAMQDIKVEDAICAFVHAWMSNQIQCAIRLGILGQNGGVALLAHLETAIAAMATQLADANENDLGSNTFLADISSMRHETLYSRIFRT